MQQHPGRVEDYTLPFLVVTFLLLLMGMWTIWVVYSFAVALTFALVAHLFIGLLPVKE